MSASALAWAWPASVSLFPAVLALAKARQVKSSCYSPKIIEQIAHSDHKPREAWVHVRRLPAVLSAWYIPLSCHFSSPYILLEG